VSKGKHHLLYRPRIHLLLLLLRLRIPHAAVSPCSGLKNPRRARLSAI
jgi:hypothetical protein